MDAAFIKSIRELHDKGRKVEEFISGISSVPVSGKVFDEEELMNGVEAVLDGLQKHLIKDAIREKKVFLLFFGVDRRFQFDYIRIEVFFL